MEAEPVVVRVQRDWLAHAMMLLAVAQVVVALLK